MNIIKLKNMEYIDYLSLNNWITKCFDDMDEAKFLKLMEKKSFGNYITESDVTEYYNQKMIGTQKYCTYK